MKIIIFGATGNIGKPLVLQALTLGYSVTAFTRNKEKLNDIKHDHLSVIEGDVLDKNTVEKAIAGHDAVICALGAGRKGTIRSQGTRSIIEGMQKNGVKRLICQSTLGAGNSRGNLNFLWKHIMFGWYLKKAYQDHQLQEKYVMDSELNWTLVRPGAFTDGKATGNFRHGFAPDDKSISLKISKADVAMFLLMQLTSDQYLRKTPGLSY
ncbi:NAD(P)-dependent oxidoreductase [Sinomicrobium weinanense]|uniref:SDR family oxidoreductase n=1 Tax=Sinomicrobium weinanense TaxID=2842200 RepID=A0A926Q305_9FLAO|nr:SDR family oxidoreductase [Sinomicrobium weinanense]MBC9797063.1 SDR family oxidoreductase [Sinomicrobium weinanense]MBU3122058.1 SDR family oxidoreductase [Sinomicrobium weinanense]